MTRRTQASREQVACVQRANGAWLVSLSGSLTDDCTPDQLYDAASSLQVAKRVAVEGARELGYTGAVRWATDPDHPQLWWLTMTYTDEWESADD